MSASIGEGLGLKPTTVRAVRSRNGAVNHSTSPPRHKKYQRISNKHQRKFLLSLSPGVNEPSDCCASSYISKCPVYSINLQCFPTINRFSAYPCCGHSGKRGLYNDGFDERQVSGEGAVEGTNLTTQYIIDAQDTVISAFDFPPVPNLSANLGCCGGKYLG